METVSPIKRKEMKKIIFLLWGLLIPLSLVKAQMITMRPLPSEPPDGGPGDPMMYQQAPGPRNQLMGRGDSRIRRQLEQIKIWQMTREMNLPTDKAEKFFPLYNQYNGEMRSITSERRRAIDELDSSVNSHAGDPQIKDQVKHILSLDGQLAATHMNFIKSLGNILSPTEVARYMVFEQRFDREIRDRIRVMMMQRGMRGRGPH